MKTHAQEGGCNFRLDLTKYGSYFVKRALKLEATLEQKHKALHLEMIGADELPADMALLFRSILLGR